MKKHSQKLISFLLTIGILMSLSISTFASEPNPSLYSENDLGNISISKQENIILFDKSDKIIAEYHTDGYSATYQYSDMFSQGNTPMVSSIEGNDGKTQIFSYDEHGEIEKIDYYINNSLRGSKDYSILKYSEDEVSPYANYTVFYVNHSDGSRTQMNNLISNSNFVRKKTSASQSDIQKLFQNNNSPLKNNITIYKKNSNNQVYNTGVTVTPAKVIYDASVTYNVSPKVILSTLQKESSLVSSSHVGDPLSMKVFWFCMGAGSTTSPSTTGFNNQINEGTRILRKWYDHGTSSSNFPYNYSNSGFKGYRGYNTTGYVTNIWCDNAATYSLYKYTPYTCYSNENTRSCNVLFFDVYNMKMFDNFPS